MEMLWQAMQREYKVVTDVEKQEVVDLGGLHVVGTERHEARRVDNQLRGRSGRYIWVQKCGTIRVSGFHD